MKNEKKMQKEESELFWNAMERASEYVNNWPKWKKEAYGLMSTQSKNERSNKIKKP